MTAVNGGVQTVLDLLAVPHQTICLDFNGAETRYRNPDLGGYLNSWSILSAVDASAWELVGVGDFNGDKTDDIAWRNMSTGLTGYWQINNKTLTGWQNIATIA